MHSILQKEISLAIMPALLALTLFAADVVAAAGEASPPESTGTTAQATTGAPEHQLFGIRPLQRIDFMEGVLERTDT